MGCEILTSAMCCEDTCGFCLRGTLEARERRACRARDPALAALGSEPGTGPAAGGAAFSFFGADAAKAPFTSYIPSSPTPRIFRTVKATIS